MTSQVRVFVNGVGADVPAGCTALAALRVVDPAAAEAVLAGERVITDSRGLPLAPETPAHGGAIYRTIGARPPRGET
ncbi:MAG: hypothetical protein NVS9B3_09890 [Gemmatimonadaceae bacterium]